MPVDKAESFLCWERRKHLYFKTRIILINHWVTERVDHPCFVPELILKTQGKVCAVKVLSWGLSLLRQGPGSSVSKM